MPDKSGQANQPDADHVGDKLVEQRRIATAYHEAGHAVMALALGRPIKKVTIQATRSQLGDRRLGTCEIQKGRTKPSKTAFEDEILILFAGMVAEARFTGRYCQTGASQDLRIIRRYLQSRSHNERQIEKTERRLLDKTENALDEPANARAIELISEELLSKTTLSGRAARHFFQQAMQQVK